VSKSKYVNNPAKPSVQHISMPKSRNLTSTGHAVLIRKPLIK